MHSEQSNESCIILKIILFQCLCNWLDVEYLSQIDRSQMGTLVPEYVARIIPDNFWIGPDQV